MNLLKKILRIIMVLILIIICNTKTGYSQNNQMQANTPQDRVNDIPSITSNENKFEIIITIRDSYKYCALGRSVSGIGDINQDGYDDIVIGNPTKNNYTGEAWIVYGGEAMDSIPDIILHGENEHDAFGGIVTSIGDINGDGDEDFAISAASYGAPLEYGKGRVYIYFGGAVFDTIPDLILTGENKYDHFGAGLTKRGCNGDVNNDETLKIDWQLPKEQLVISTKDKNLLAFTSSEYFI